MATFSVSRQFLEERIESHNMSFCSSTNNLIVSSASSIDNSSLSSIIGGQNNIIDYGIGNLVSGASSSIIGSNNSAIISSLYSSIENSQNSIILGGIGLTLSGENDTVYVSKLKIGTASLSISPTNILIRDFDGYVGYSEFSGLSGTFSGTFSVPDGRTVVVTDGVVKDIFYYNEIGYISPISEGTINSGLSVTIRDYFDNGVDKVTFKTDQLFSVLDNGFTSNTYITSLELHGATSIGDGSFQSCNSLTSIYLPQVQTIGDYSFQDCSSLTTVDLPQVQTIGDNSFYGCSSLTTIDLPQVQTIGDASFYVCSSLISVKIPKCNQLGTTTGDNNVFNYCSTGLSVTTNIVLKTNNSGLPDGDLDYVINLLSGIVLYVNDYAYVLSAYSINAQTVDLYTMSAYDAGKLITMDNPNPQTIVIDTYNNVPFLTGDKIDIVQLGSGIVSLSPESGVTLNSINGWTNISGQYAGVTLINLSTDNWLLIGSLSA